MKPGKELNEKVAKEVMGMQQHPDFPHLWKDPSSPTNPFMPVPKFSEEISAGLLAAEALRSLNYRIQINMSQNYQKRPFYSCEVWTLKTLPWKTEGEQWLESGELIADESGLSVPHAICLAAIKTLEKKP